MKPITRTVYIYGSLLILYFSIVRYGLESPYIITYMIRTGVRWYSCSKDMVEAYVLVRSLCPSYRLGAAPQTIFLSEPAFHFSAQVVWEQIFVEIV